MIFINLRQSGYFSELGQFFENHNLLQIVMWLGDKNAIREKPNMTYWSEEWEGWDSRKFSSHIVILKTIFFFFCKGGKMWNIVENSQSANYFERVKHLTVSDWLPNTMICSITKLRLILSYITIVFSYLENPVD